MTDKSKRVTIKLDEEYYPKEAVISACCQFLRDSYVFLERVTNKGIEVTLTPKDNENTKNLKEALKNELINSTLRYNIAQRNKDIRDYIIKAALFSSKSRENKDDILSGDLEAQLQNWKDDPLGIAIPWEEKHGKKQKRKR